MIKRKCAILLMVATMMTLAGCKHDDIEYSGAHPVERGDVCMKCIEGNMFAIFIGYEKGGITQVWENGPNGPRPIECTQEEK